MNSGGKKAEKQTHTPSFHSIQLCVYPVMLNASEREAKEREAKESKEARLLLIVSMVMIYFQTTAELESFQLRTLLLLFNLLLLLCIN